MLHVNPPCGSPLARRRHTPPPDPAPAQDRTTILINRTQPGLTHPRVIPSHSRAAPQHGSRPDEREMNNACSNGLRRRPLCSFGRASVGGERVDRDGADRNVGQRAGSIAVTFIAGLVFCWLRLRSRSLIAPIMAHVPANGLALTVAWFTVR
ncbi:MAG: lysostaphin resistance A-like protein [Streptosporangiaceae bacterium]